MQQAHQLFQRDAQTITPETLQSVKAALATSDVLDPTANARPSDPSTTKKPVPRRATGQTWEDPTLTDRPESTCEFLPSFLSFRPLFTLVLFIYLCIYASLTLSLNNAFI
jgi:hypothetical protein